MADLSEAAQALFEAACNLPESDRVTLTFRLWDMLPPPDDLEEVTEEEFHAELKRRVEEADRDPSVCVSLEEVHAMVDRELADLRKSENKS
jgi:putative addiction module component (TIGR02574 family)